MTEKDEIIFTENLNKKDLRFRYCNWEYDLCHEVKSHFSISIPDTWYISEMFVDYEKYQNKSTSLVTFKKSKTSTAEIEVFEEVLTREISPEDWLMLLIQKLGRRVIERRVFNQQSGNILDCLVLSSEGENIYRMFALKNEDRILLIEARSETREYIDANLAEAFFVAVADFAVLHPSDWSLAEHAKTYSRQIPGDFCIIYPESWDLIEAEGYDPEKIRIIDLTNNVDGSEVGNITTLILEKKMAVDQYTALDLYVEGMESRGIKLPPMNLSEIAIDAFEKSWETKASVGSELDKSANAELNITIGSNSDAWFVIGLLTPARKYIPEIWAINKRAYEIWVGWLRTSVNAR